MKRNISKEKKEKLPIKIISFTWTIPTFGNKHSNPYGKITLSDSMHQIKKDFEINCEIIFYGRKFIIKNVGTLYNPNLIINEI